MIRKTIEGKTKVVFSSRKEEDVINYLDVSPRIWTSDFLNER